MYTFWFTVNVTHAETPSMKFMQAEEHLVVPFPCILETCTEIIAFYTGKNEQIIQSRMRPKHAISTIAQNCNDG